MSDVVIGIDLGTTNSCVAIPEWAEVKNRDDLVAARRLISMGGALVLTDASKAVTTPSAVWVDPRGSVVVGRSAKKYMRVPGEPPPALFFKRLMGTSERVTAGHASLTPVEASSHVLRHLKAMAEELLQAEIDRAVITVPAFFQMNAKLATTEAGTAAGLEVLDTLLEPVAAALMYTRTSPPTDEAKFMVYDLGGGTFDVSIVTWDPEVGFEMAAFDGDPFLGGYDFDRAIANWMIERLKDSYDLALDIEDDAEDASVFYQLLARAEAEKHELSDELETTIVDTKTTDTSGNLMNIWLPLARHEFETMIEPSVSRTLESCDRALERAGVAADEIDEIIMVGGSSEIPLVGRRLEERYGRKPRIIDPHLCVAVGAALKAATMATFSTYLSLDPLPERTALESLDVAGAVLPGPELASVAGVSVQLVSDDGLLDRREATNEGGRFLFDEVPLRTGTTTGFTLHVVPDGKPLVSHKLVVEHDWEGGGQVSEGPVGDVLARDVSVLLASGPHVVAPMGTRVPFHADPVRPKTIFVTDRIPVKLLDGDQPIGEVVVKDLPSTLPAGTPVEIDLVFNRDWTIDASASVPSVPGASASAVIEIPLIDVPSWEELQRTYTEVLAAWNERRSIAQPAALLTSGPRIEDLLGQALDLLNERQDRAHTHSCLQEAATLIDTVPIGDSGGGGLQPPLEEFEESLRELAALAKRLEAKDTSLAMQHQAAIPTLETAGKAAYEAGEQGDWTFANQNVERRIQQIKGILEPSDGPQISCAQFQLLATMKLAEIVASMDRFNEQTNHEHAGQIAALRSEAESFAHQLAGVDCSDESAGLARVQAIYFHQIEPLRVRFEQLTKIVIDKIPIDIPAPLAQPGPGVRSMKLTE